MSSESKRKRMDTVRKGSRNEAVVVLGMAKVRRKVKDGEDRRCDRTKELEIFHSLLFILFSLQPHSSGAYK